MNKTDIRDLLKAYPWDRGYGKGFGYDWFLNGDWYPSKKDMLKVIEEGDNINLSVYTARGGYEVDSIRFKVEDSSETQDLLEYYRQQRSSNRTKNGNIRDYQKTKVYRWERAVIRESGLENLKLTFDQSVALVEEIFFTYGKEAPEVIEKRALKKFSYSYHDGSIGLAKEWGNNKKVVIHEAAHSLLTLNGFASGSVISPHGPEFVAVYVELLELFLGIDRKLMLRLIDWYGLDHSKGFSV